MWAKIATRSQRPHQGPVPPRVPRRSPAREARRTGRRRRANRPARSTARPQILGSACPIEEGLDLSVNRRGIQLLDISPVVLVWLPAGGARRGCVRSRSDRSSDRSSPETGNSDTGEDLPSGVLSLLGDRAAVPVDLKAGQTAGDDPHSGLGESGQGEAGLVCADTGGFRSLRHLALAVLLFLAGLDDDLQCAASDVVFFVHSDHLQGFLWGRI